jgi:hypothetical protein
VFSQAPFPATAYLARVFYATRSNGNLKVHVAGRGKLRQVIDSVRIRSWFGAPVKAGKVL